MVTKIIRARWQENQLVDSGLKREEMETIARVFVDIWQQFHHRRIPYPTVSHGAKVDPPYPVPLAPVISGNSET